MEIDGRTIEGCSTLLNHENFSHTRSGDGCWREVIWIYHRDVLSPSGVTLAGSTTEAIFNAVPTPPAGSSPLSPVEPR